MFFENFPRLGEVNPCLVKSVQKLHEIVDIHYSGSFLFKIYASKHFVHLLFDVKPVRDWPSSNATLHLVILLHHQQDTRTVKSCTQCFVFSNKTNPC